MNIIIDYIQYYKSQNYEYENVVSAINILRKNHKIIFPYSPAHIEEVAVINRKNITDQQKQKYINQNLKIISKLSENNELLPTFDCTGVTLKTELPIDCFERVKFNYENNTIVAENQEYRKIDNWKTIRLQINQEKINKLSPEEIFKNEEIIEKLQQFLDAKIDSHLQDLLINLEAPTTLCLVECFKMLTNNSIPNFKNIKNNYQCLEFLFENIFDFLDNIGYKNDKKARKRNKHRSRMHDITHGIYATSSDILITSDDYFKNKLQAIYSLLNIKTKIIGTEELVILHTPN